MNSRHDDRANGTGFSDEANLKTVAHHAHHEDRPKGTELTKRADVSRAMFACRLDDNKKSFFDFPPEVRNQIYENLLDEVQDPTIRILGGQNARLNKLEPTVADGLMDADDKVDEDGRQSQLNIVRACKQLNFEFSPMLYSKMTLSLNKLPTFIPKPDSTSKPHVEQANYVKELLGGVRRVFDPLKIACISTLVIQHRRLLSRLISCDSLLRARVTLDMSEQSEQSLWLEARDEALQAMGHPVRDTFKSITRVVVIDQLAKQRSVYNILEPGMSWLSLDLEPRDEKYLLRTFPKLDEIVVREGTEEQVNKIVDGHVVVADSGKRMGGYADWSR